MKNIIFSIFGVVNFRHLTVMHLFILASTIGYARPPIDPNIVSRYFYADHYDGSHHDTALAAVMVTFNYAVSSICSNLGPNLSCHILQSPVCIQDTTMLPVVRFICNSAVAILWSNGSSAGGFAPGGTFDQDVEIFCESGSMLMNPTRHCECAVGTAFVSASEMGLSSPAYGKCVETVNLLQTPAPPSTCSPLSPTYGNPIAPLTGSKLESIDLGIKISGTNIHLYYNSSRRAAAPDGNMPGKFNLKTDSDFFGTMWSNSLFKRLVVQANALGVLAVRGDGSVVTFSQNQKGNFDALSGITDRLVRKIDGYTYIDFENGLSEIYDHSGNILYTLSASGNKLIYSYSDLTTAASVAPTTGYLISVTDENSRQLRFKYKSIATIGQAWRVSTIFDSAGSEVNFTYDDGINLTAIIWQDNTTRRFFYDYPSLPWALTRIYDENANPVSTFEYDTQGRASSTKNGNGRANYYSVLYSSPPWLVTDDEIGRFGQDASKVVFRNQHWVPPVGTKIILPSGFSTDIQAISINAKTQVLAKSQVAGSGCSASNSALKYDAHGNLAAVDDFNGNRICLSMDATRNLETARVEGLINSGNPDNCQAITVPHAALPVDSRKISTVWHDGWKIKVSVAEPERITTRVYNGQPDPFAGNVIASCVPESINLPIDERLVVLCSEVEVATIDLTGALGFTAQLQSDIAPRRRKWTYNLRGQPLTYDGPRTDVADTTIYSYFAETTFTGTDPHAVGHTLGDLRQVTNPAGHITHYTKYNKHGHVLEMIDTNGVVTTYTYDLRQKPISVSVAGQATAYSYDLAGQLKRITWSDNSYVGYDYDSAHRQVAVYDNLDNRVDYTLDNDGNRIAERTKDSTGTLRRALSRSIDALNRVQQITGRE